MVNFLKKHRKIIIVLVGGIIIMCIGLLVLDSKSLYIKEEAFQEKIKNIELLKYFKSIETLDIYQQDWFIERNGYLENMEVEDFDTETKSMYSNINSRSKLITTEMNKTWITENQDIEGKKLNEVMSKLAILDNDGNPTAYHMDEIDKLLHKKKLELKYSEYLTLMKITTIMPVKELEKLLNKGLEKNSDTKKDSVTEVMKEVQLRLDSLAQGIVNTEINLTDEQRNALERAALINGVITDLEENTVAECGSFIKLKEVDNTEKVIYTAEINRINFYILNGKNKVYDDRKINIYKWSNPHGTKKSAYDAVGNTLKDLKKGAISKSRKASTIGVNTSQIYFETLGITAVVVETESGITLNYQQVDMQELSEKIKYYNQAAKNSSTYPVISEDPTNMMDEFVIMEPKELKWFNDWWYSDDDEEYKKIGGFNIGIYYGIQQ